jgi:membrane protease YdiL (CAAX protease family)
MSSTSGGDVDLQFRQQRLRGSVWLALAEFAIVAGLFYADIHHHIYISKTPYIFLLGWASLRLRGLRWKDVGFARPRSWGKALLLGIVVGVCMEATELFVTQPLLARWLGKMPDLSDFAEMVGNLKVFLLYVVLVWVLGALGEEIDYRGYLMNRVAGVFRDTKAAWVVSLIVVSIVFGCGHLDQGATGMIENVWNGLLLGALYLACGRNLAVPVIAHAVGDTLDFILIYLGKYPGMH